MAKQKEPKAPRNFDAIVGLLLVFVLVSIGYSTYVVFFGTEGLVPKVMLVPQAAWAALVLIRQFTTK